jgi:hypothetical protein
MPSEWCARRMVFQSPAFVWFLFVLSRTWQKNIGTRFAFEIEHAFFYFCCDGKWVRHPNMSFYSFKIYQNR